MITTTDSRHSTAQKLRKMTVKQLRNLCKQLSLKGYSKLRKDDLIDFIIDEVWDSEVEQQCQEVPEELPTVAPATEPASETPQTRAIAAEQSRLAQYQTELLGVEVGSSLPLFAIAA